MLRVSGVPVQRPGVSGRRRRSGGPDQSGKRQRTRRDDSEPTTSKLNLSASHSFRATVNTSHSKYSGRVGALAVALGVGGAVATTPGLAWADDPPSSAST